MSDEVTVSVKFEVCVRDGDETAERWVWLNRKHARAARALVKQFIADLKALKKGEEE
jgi:hypothetical protein